jgi:hypothetical protein
MDAGKKINSETSCVGDQIDYNVYAALYDLILQLGTYSLNSLETPGEVAIDSVYFATEDLLDEYEYGKCK